MTRVYLFKVNWLAQFFWAIVFALISLCALIFFLASLGDKHATIGFSLGCLFVGIGTGFLSIGAALNGGRIARASYRTHFGWRR